MGAAHCRMIIDSDDWDHSRKFPTFSTSRFCWTFLWTCDLLEFFGGFKMVCWWFWIGFQNLGFVGDFSTQKLLKPFWSFVFAVFFSLWNAEAVDGFVEKMPWWMPWFRSSFDRRHPALGKAKTFRSRKQSGRPRSVGSHGIWSPVCSHPI